MITSWQNGKTIARRLRVRCVGVEPLSAQLRAESLLSQADVRPPGLPPAAVLCVRTLRDPLPGSVPLRQGGLRPPRAWEQAVGSELKHLLRRAARPALGPPPASAEAVIFADQAELLACLASDWCDGSIFTRWWWHGLFKGVGGARALFSAWQDAPEAIPAAMQHLAAQGKAVPFVRALNQADVRLLLHHTLRCFALPQLATALEAAFDESRSLPVEEATRTTLRSRRGDTEPAQALVKHQAPWARWVPESTESGLHFEQQCLLGMTLLLRRAPAVVRAPAFVAAVRHFARARQNAVNGGAVTLAVAPSFMPGEGRVVVESAGFLTEERESGDDDIVGAPAVEHQAPSGHAPAINGQLLFDQTGAVLDGPESHVVPVLIHQGDGKTLEAANLFEAQVQTAFGGVFYLINLGLFLCLYGDFTTPLEPGIALPLWDFVALLGQHLLGARIQADPVWTLLEDLAGRSRQEAPGKDFIPPEEWRIPVEWLKPFSEPGVWKWTTACGRLCIQHAEGFCVLDVPLAADDSAQQVLRETQPYRERISCELQPGSSSNQEGERTPLERWLNWLLPYVRARLSRALDLVHPDDLAALLCEQPAHILLTATRLDVIFALADLPIEVRLAGLDRNPGWVPAAGRFIAFHFE